MEKKRALLEVAEEVLGLPQDEMAENLSLDLFDNELIDSLGCMSMMASLGDKLGVEIPIEQFTPDDFVSLASMLDALQRIGL